MFNIRFILLLLSVMFPFYSYGCTYNFIGPPYTVNYGNIIVQRDVAVGQPISNEIYGSMAPAFSCVTTADEGSSNGLRNEVLSYVFTSASGHRVYNTNVAGVGISFGYNRNVTAGSSSFSGVAYLDSTNLTTFSYSSNPFETDASNLQPIIQLWKTGDIISGQLNGQLASFVGYTQRYRGGTLAAEVPINAGTGSITQVACAIRTGYISFDLGKISAEKFSTDIGTTPAEAQKTQNLILDCDSQANINLMLSGTQNPKVSNPSVLALTGQDGAGVASGVGVQLVYNNVPLELNTNIVLKRSTGGVEMFPLTARYYQTEATVLPGAANASATLNLTYQ